jgi:hypothetical protein
MLGFGGLLDRLGTPRLMPWFQLPMVLAFLLLTAGDSLIVAARGMACLALTAGAYATVPNAFWAEFYGTRSLGAIKALATALGLGLASRRL